MGLVAGCVVAVAVSYVDKTGRCVVKSRENPRQMRVLISTVCSEAGDGIVHKMSGVCIDILTLQIIL